MIPFFLFRVVSFADSNHWTLIAEKLQNSTVIIRQDAAICSGAVIAPGRILTAAHCAFRLRPITIQKPMSPGNPQSFFYPAQIVRMDLEQDLVLLEIQSSDRSFAAWPSLEIRPFNETLRIGEPLATMGHPLASSPIDRWGLLSNLTFVFSQGVVAKINSDDWQIVADVSASPGNSGGPVVDFSGRLIGVTSKKIVKDNAGDLMIATGGFKLHEFLYVKPDSIPKWYQAATTVNLSLNYLNYHLSDLKSFDHSYNLEVAFYIWDRLEVGLSNSIDGSQTNDETRRLGLKMQADLTVADVLYFYPSFVQKSIHYTNDLGVKIDRNLSGAELGIQYSRAPILLRWAHLIGESGFLTDQFSLTVNFLQF